MKSLRTGVLMDGIGVGEGCPGRPIRVSDAKARRTFHLWSLLAYSAVSLLLAAVTEAPLGWDVLNYHLYVAHAWIDGRLPAEYFAAGPQSYLNPLGHVPYYVVYMATDSGWPLFVGMALLHSVNLWLLHFICSELVAPAIRQARWLIVGGVLVGGLSPGFVALISRSHAEIVVSLPCLASLLFLLRWNFAGPNTKSATNFVLAAGFFAGIAVGMKPTSVLFVFSIFLGMAITTRRSLWVPGTLAACAFALGFLAANGAHAWMLWQSFDSPVFPLFNGLFRSPWFMEENFVSGRFIPASVASGLMLPIEMLNPVSFVTAEFIAVDARPALLVAGVAFVVLLRLFGRAPVATSANSEWRAEAFMGLVLAVCSIGWVVSSSNMRYALELFLLIGPSVSLVSVALLKFNRVASLLFLGVTLFIQVVLALGVNAGGGMSSNIQGIEARRPRFEVPVEIAREPAYFVSLQSQSFASSVVSLHPESRLTNLASISPRDSSRSKQRFLDTLSASGLPLRTLYAQSVERARDVDSLVAASRESQNAILSEYGLALGPGACHSIRLRTSGTRNANESLAASVVVSCPVGGRPNLGLDDVKRRAEIDARMDRWVEKCPDAFSPSGTWSVQLPKLRRRTYANSDYTLAAMEDGRLLAMPLDPALSLLVLEDAAGKVMMVGCPPLG